MSDDTFRFPLFRVLEFREAAEKESASILARAHEDAVGAQRQLDDLVGLRNSRGARVSEARTEGGAVGHLQNLGLVQEQLDEMVRRADERRLEAETALIRRREDFRRAHLERKTMDHLRDRRREEWRTEQVRRAQRLLDELAGTRRGLAALEDGGAAL